VIVEVEGLLTVSDYGFQVEVREGYEEAVVRTRMALRAEGFSVITEMHVGGLLGSEAGEARQYLIMGAWTRTSSTLRVDDGLEVAMHLPCNFVVQETGTSAIVATLDPGDAPESGDRAHGDPTEEARAALGRVLQRVGEPG
jgi:uncharacterized protein (DUF302 family)